ncbi:hypothetical protein [Citrobacter sp. R-1.5.2]|uniref:hypothetical protein n=1 Tax=Citrobacter sp. R-1.5.2 TaxID=3046183 RepID=UPI002B23F4C2|nr:hypothetical protein [Citrobacter sp. R-1.5.2]MEB2416677.1 hypothetical protein [Citrobacter sp. R-1.5.2]
MPKNNNGFNCQNRMQDWLTINEAVQIARRRTNMDLTHSGIYRHALCGDISLSIYFQSPVILRKVRTSDLKTKLRLIPPSFINRICLLEKNCFLNGRNLILSTEGKYIYPTQRIIDTTLTGYEYVLTQRLLARSLGIPQPITGANKINYGITVTLSGETFQVLEKTTWEERIKRQLVHFPKEITEKIHAFITSQSINRLQREGYFPIHTLPKDACFVIRYAELEKLIEIPFAHKKTPPSSTRISTPLSRLFWLACKHNHTISPLIRQPYKLLSIFEQWASDDGITDRLSGDTLKTALERGSPTTSASS